MGRIAAGSWIIAVAACGGAAENHRAPTTGVASFGSDAGDDSEADGSEGGDKLDLGPGVDVAPDTEGDACVAASLEPELGFAPIDVIVIIDSSDSMDGARAAVEQSINGDFAEILGASGLDYRVILIGAYPWICVEPPLGGAPCDPHPATPAATPVFFPYSGATGSGNFFANLLAFYAEPDPYDLAPGGFSQWLRPGARKIFVGMTDGNSMTDNHDVGLQWDAELLALAPEQFGTAAARNYVFHTFVSMPANEPVTTPWSPGDPIAGHGQALQVVSVTSGGLRFPLGHDESFGVVFQEIATGVVESTPIACEFPVPTTPDGEAIDPDTVEIDYRSGGGPPSVLHQVVDATACVADGFWIAGGIIHLCPAACAPIQADPAALLEVRYGCDVGFEPAG
jgi:hypothetical protein